MLIKYEDSEEIKKKYKKKINFNLIEELIETINANETFFKEMYNLHKYGCGDVNGNHYIRFGTAIDPLGETVLDMYFGMKLEEGNTLDNVISIPESEQIELGRFTEFIRKKGIETLL